jgi:hypothetical protein
MWKEFHPTPGDLMAFYALSIMGSLLMMLVFREVPTANKELFTFGLGAISGALTVAGGRKIADKITNASGDNPSIQADATPKEPEQ